MTAVQLHDAHPIGHGVGALVVVEQDQDQFAAAEIRLRATDHVGQGPLRSATGKRIDEEENLARQSFVPVLRRLASGTLNFVFS